MASESSIGAIGRALILPYDPDAERNQASALWQLVPANASGKAPEAGTARLFFDQNGVTAVSSLGSEFTKKNENEKREAIRRAVGGAVKSLKGEIVPPGGTAEVEVDTFGDAHAAAVAAHLAQWSFTLKTDPPSRFDPRLQTIPREEVTFVPLQQDAQIEWERGKVYADAQNFARTLMELPANMMTPTIFCQTVKNKFENSDLSDVEIIIRDTEWAKSKNMNTFLSVTHGSHEPAKFLEICYKGAADAGARPLALVGKGITFDSGGISLKSRLGMKSMRADMGGAACVVATTFAIAKLKLPSNVVCVTPLTENMPGGSATKPGDIVYAMNGKSVEIDNTDAEGRLVLADAMWYASTEFNPHTMIDVATLTGAMGISLGQVYAGVFCTDDELWEDLQQAGETEYDRFWRMPLDEEYGPQIYSSNADLQNTGGAPAGSCTAALFLKAFANGIEGEHPRMKWAHLDMGNVTHATRPTMYLEDGLTGRSIRALIEYVRGLQN